MVHFERHPADPAALDAAAHRAGSSAHRFSALGADVDTRTSLAASAVSGTMAAPMATVGDPVVAGIDQVAAACTVAGGCLRRWNTAVGAHNRVVDDLNAERAAAQAAGFGVELVDMPAAESDPGVAARQLRDARDQASQANLGVLNARYATSLNHLNGEADTTARMLDEGPTEQVIHALTAGGDLPLPPPVVPPLPPFWPDIWEKWLKELEERFFGPPIDWDRSFSDQRWGAIGTYFGIIALVMTRYWGDWLVKGRYGTFQPRGIPPGQVPLLPFRERLRLAQDGDNFPPRPGFEAKQDWWKKFREHTLHGIVVLVGGVAAEE